MHGSYEYTIPVFGHGAQVFNFRQTTEVCCSNQQGAECPLDFFFATNLRYRTDMVYKDGIRPIYGIMSS